MNGAFITLSLTKVHSLEWNTSGIQISCMVLCVQGATTVAANDKRKLFMAVAVC